MPFPLTPELENATAPVAPAPTPASPTVNAGLDAMQAPSISSAPPVSPNPPVSLTPAAPVLPKPATTFGQKLHEVLLRNPLNFKNPLANVAVAGIDALASDAGSNLLASTGAGANAKVAPGGSGFLTGLAAQQADFAARRQDAADRAARAKQQQFENDQRTQALDLEKQRTAAEIASANASMHASERAARNADMEAQQNMLKNDRAAAQPFIDAGATVVAQGLTSDQLAEFMKNNPTKVSATQNLSFKDGIVGVYDSKGNPVLDKNGDPEQRFTYEILTPVPQITLDPKDPNDAAVIALYNKQNPNSPIGKDGNMTLPGSTYYGMVKQIQAKEVVQNNIDHLRAETNYEKSETEKNQMSIADEQQLHRAQTIFGPYLGAADGDAVIALQQMRLKDPKHVGLVERAYGPGVIEKYRLQQIESDSKVIEDDQKAIAEIRKTAPKDLAGNPQLGEDDLNQIANYQSEISQAAAQRATYMKFGPKPIVPVTPSTAQTTAASPKDAVAAYRQQKSQATEQSKAAAQRNQDLNSIQVMTTAPGDPGQPHDNPYYDPDFSKLLQSHPQWNDDQKIEALHEWKQPQTPALGTPGMVAVRTADGKIGQVPAANVPNFLKNNPGSSQVK